MKVTKAARFTTVTSGRPSSCPIRHEITAPLTSIAPTSAIEARPVARWAESRKRAAAKAWLASSPSHAIMLTAWNATIGV